MITTSTWRVDLVNITKCNVEFSIKDNNVDVNCFLTLRDNKTIMRFGCKKHFFFNIETKTYSFKEGEEEEGFVKSVHRMTDDI